MLYIMAFLVVAGVTAFIIWPLVTRGQHQAGTTEGDRRRDLAAQRDLLYRQLADLNVDQQAGKLDDQEFRAQREEYLDAAAVILEELDADEAVSLGAGLRAAVEAEILRVREAETG